jgi:nicotinate-nucleotide--dimethylbenzimidazole phosphoribosyltransferase
MADGRTWLADLVSTVVPGDAASALAAEAELERKTKPRGSLGRLEALAVQIAAARRSLSLEALPGAVLVAAADHGYAAAGVSAYPQEVTRQMLRNIVAGGAAVSVLARASGARLELVDVGVIDGEANPRIRTHRLAPGTRDATAGPAMTPDEARAAVELGARITTELAADGIAVLALGEMGIGNTTAASAIAAALLGVAPERVCGRGTGIDDAGWERKVATVAGALKTNGIDASDPLHTLTAVGGLEIAFLVGAMLGGAAARLVLVLDGFIVGSAALVATRLAPPVRDYMVASHLSPEPGHGLLLSELGLTPLLDWQLRLGEGSGATLALPLLRSAGAILAEMATFAGAGVTDTGR